jgi:hypothetical protein
MIVMRGAGAVLLAAAVLIGAACDQFDGSGSDQYRPAHTESDEPSNVPVWGCGRSIPKLPERPDPEWLAQATLVGDFGFGVNAHDFQVWRPHENADFQFKLPIFTEGHSGGTVWIPRSQQTRVGLILADVPRRGPGNSYRVEDGHLGARFEPCAHKEWTAWTGALALADRREIVLMVKVDGAVEPERVVLGPWERD